VRPWSSDGIDDVILSVMSVGHWEGAHSYSRMIWSRELSGDAGSKRGCTTVSRLGLTVGVIHIVR
jgi:hypothetical protein